MEVRTSGLWEDQSKREAVIAAARVLLNDYDAHRKGSERPSMEALRVALAALDKESPPVTAGGP